MATGILISIFEKLPLRGWKIFIWIIVIGCYLPQNLLLAQDFFKPGATWHYEFTNVSNVGFKRLKYEQDTIIQNKSYQVISVYSVMVGWDAFIHEYILLQEKYEDPLLFHTDQDTIWFYNIVQGKNYRYAVLNLFPGNGWDVGLDTTTFKCGSTYNTVSNTGKILVNSDSLRFWQIIQAPNSSLAYNGMMVERLGFLGSGYLWPSLNICDENGPTCPTYYEFKCYYDPEIGLYNIKPQESCEHWLILTSRTESNRHSKETLTIWPNPVRNQLFISGIQSIDFPTEIKLYDANGKTVYTHIFSEGNIPTIDVSNLPKGIYSIIIMQDYQQYFNKVIIH